MVRKKTILQNLKYNLIIIWEHDYLYQINTNADMKKYITSLDLQERIRPRDALRGGRTEAFYLLYDCKDDEEIHYLDFNGLYPFVLKTSQFPVGHPQIICRNFKSIDNYFGIAKVKVLPPKRLLIPVLSYYANSKAIYGLCKVCIENEIKNSCNHTEEQRTFVGTYYTEALIYAISLGYTIIKIYEVWHWNEKSNKIFEGYINYHVGKKDEASGYPKYVKTEAQKDEYVENYKKNQNIILDKKNISENPPRQKSEKRMTTNLWGKLGENSADWKRYQIATDIKNFYKFTKSQIKKISNFHICDNNMVLLEWKYMDTSLAPTTFHQNAPVAGWVSMTGQLRLNKFLTLLGKNALYVDTDSYIFKKKKRTTRLHFLI